ncbi:MAG: hypothetical protein IIU11_07145 [Bacteroidales bacterium]|nr:hypothetical protein [Bacteroidales bacterium]
MIKGTNYFAFIKEERGIKLFLVFSEKYYRRRFENSGFESEEGESLLCTVNVGQHVL